MERTSDIKEDLNSFFRFPLKKMPQPTGASLIIRWYEKVRL